jgi:hypothetical protein
VVHKGKSLSEILYVAVNKRPPEAIILYSCGIFESSHEAGCVVCLVSGKHRLLSLFCSSVRLLNTNRVHGAMTDHPGRSDSTRSEELVQFSGVVSNDWYSPVAGGSRAFLRGYKDKIHLV